MNYCWHYWQHMVWCSALLDAVEGRMWSTVTQLDSAEATTPMVRNKLQAVWFTTITKCKNVTSLTHWVCLSFYCICFPPQPIGILWRQCSMEWKEAQHSWSARPGLLMCLSNGIFRRRTVTGDERFVSLHITYIYLVQQTGTYMLWTVTGGFSYQHPVFISQGFHMT